MYICFKVSSVLPSLRGSRKFSFSYMCQLRRDTFCVPKSFQPIYIADNIFKLAKQIFRIRIKQKKQKEGNKFFILSYLLILLYIIKCYMVYLQYDITHLNVFKIKYYNIYLYVGKPFVFLFIFIIFFFV